MQIVEDYTAFLQAINQILVSKGRTMTVWPVVHIACDFRWVEQPLEGPPLRPTNQAPRAERPSPYGAGGVTPWSSASGSSGSAGPWGRATWSTTSWNAAPEIDTYPKWQYQGSKKRRWTDYDATCQEQLELAFTNGLASLDLTIDGWEYTVWFQSPSDTMQQVSMNTGTARGVRRLTGPPAPELD